MKRVAAAEANRNFSRLMREAEAGETIVITSHGEPRVKMSSVKAGDDASKQDVVRRKRAWRALFARIDTQPETTIRWKFNRDELYEPD